MLNLRKILISDSDSEACESLRVFLLKQGYKPITATTAKQTLVKFNSLSVDLVLIDLKMLVAENWEIFLSIKNKFNMPIIIFVEKDTLLNSEVVLNFCTFNNFMLKPINMDELVIKIKMLYKQSLNVNKNVYKRVIKKKDLLVDLSNYEIYINNKKIKAAPKEIELLYKLLSCENTLFTREQLLDDVWGYDYIGSSRTVDMHIKRIREKLRKNSSKYFIETVWGLGYMLKTLK